MSFLLRMFEFVFTLSREYIWKYFAGDSKVVLTMLGNARLGIAVIMYPNMFLPYATK